MIMVLCMTALSFFSESIIFAAQDLTLENKVKANIVHYEIAQFRSNLDQLVNNGQSTSSIVLAVDQHLQWKENHIKFLYKIGALCKIGIAGGAFYNLGQGFLGNMQNLSYINQVLFMGSIIGYQSITAQLERAKKELAFLESMDSAIKSYQILADISANRHIGSKSIP